MILLIFHGILQVFSIALIRTRQPSSTIDFHVGRHRKLLVKDEDLGNNRNNAPTYVLMLQKPQYGAMSFVFLLFLCVIVSVALTYGVVTCKSCKILISIDDVECVRRRVMVLL